MRAIVLIVGAIVSTCVLAVLANVLIGDEGNRSHTASIGPRPTDRLTVCVQAVDLDDEIEPAAKLAIEAALEDLVVHPVWQDTPYSKSPPEVREGCPGGPALKDRQRNFDDAVDTPSYFKIHVFLLPEVELNRIMGPSAGRGNAEEFECAGDACAQVTSGIYVSDQELDDDEFLVTQLDEAIGLSASLVLE